MATNAPREEGKGLVDQVSAIQAEVASLREFVSNLTANQQPPIPPRQSMTSAHVQNAGGVPTPDSVTTVSAAEAQNIMQGDVARISRRNSR